MLRSIPRSEHVLDFASDLQMPLLPKRLSLMVGAGDLIHNEFLNVEMFTSDVFFCNAWDVNGSFQANIDYLENEGLPRIICVVDYNDDVQRRRFIDAFKGRFYLIDGHGGHVPHFTVAELEELLCVGGDAMNIHEKSETMLPLKDAKYFLQNGHFPGYTARHSYFTGRIYNSEVSLGQRKYGPLTDEEVAELEQVFIENIRATVRSTKFGLPNQISLDTDILENLERMGLSSLQQIATCLYYEKSMPLNMKGRICMNMRAWKDVTQLEIVMKKVSVDFFEWTEYNLETQERAYRIIEAIQRDMERGDIFGQCAKYKTLQKLAKI